MEMSNQEKIKMGITALGGVASGVAYHQKFSNKKTKHRIWKSVGVGLLGQMATGAVVMISDGLISQ